MDEHDSGDRAHLDALPPYNLPVTVDSNIPRTWNHADPAAWSIARGILRELCRELHASPISVLYQELTGQRNRDFIGLRITARARPPYGNDTIVIYRSESPHTGTSGGRWSLAVNGLIPISRMDLTRPPPRTIARLAREALKVGLDT
ncbi:hypothetical protein [Amycolatopsis alba]|uniref:Uncharacterized protein n=1 Tax=Amycolatopsis alba DSM 44262 TaxID=1125972 RepID=A0A229RM14_AMYAL|nr:hypothetical protein [Amycolatopsis alba]OXM47501.1 hypothetical protein CFP75_23745 [Amycolatopsis alba DSM 44262]